MFLIARRCICAFFHTRRRKVLIDIDYYKNRMQILALKPAPIQVRMQVVMQTLYYCTAQLPDIRSTSLLTLERVALRRTPLCL